MKNFLSKIPFCLKLSNLSVVWLYFFNLKVLKKNQLDSSLKNKLILEIDLKIKRVKYRNLKTKISRKIIWLFYFLKMYLKWYINIIVN
jgi:hypothetical protein